MPTYTISSRSDRGGFDVEVEGPHGAQQIKTGFKTQSDAENWIFADARSGERREQEHFRLSWRY